MALIIADRVKETTTTAGSRVLALSGAMTGFRTFASQCTVGDTLYYCVQAVDSGGSPTGEWECGLGTYSAANQLTMTTRTASSSGADISFAAGTKQVFITMPAVQVAWVRERLTAERTYYVATTGSDSNSGLTAGAPFLTIWKAIDTIAAIDCSIYNVTVQVADGTYSGMVSVAGPFTGTGLVTLQGNVSTPGNVVLTHSGVVIQVADGGKLQASGFKVSSSGSSGIRALRNGVLFFGAFDFGSCAISHIIASAGGIVQQVTGSYSVSGGAQNHVNCVSTAVVQVAGIAVTLTGTPAFSSAYALGATGGVIFAVGCTFSGSATGARYTITGNSVCDTGGSPTTYFPGNAAHGTPTATGGQYV